MKKVAKIISVLMLTILMQGCNPSNQSSATPQGGVDGSGGDLPKWTYESFDEWVQQEHRYLVRDVIHRLYLIHQNSPNDFQTLRPYVDRFLSSSEQEMNQLLDSIQYYVVKGSCSSREHADKDASVTPDGRICISYSAFKNIPLAEIVPQLIFLTLHEISHLKGFNEADAVTFQATLMRTDLNKKTILFFNQDYVDFKKTLKKMTEHIAITMTHRYDNNPDGDCVTLIRARERMEDFNWSLQKVPTFIQEKVRNGIMNPILKSTCDYNKNYSERQEKMAQVLTSILELRDILENFESPLCTNNLCAYGRSSLYFLSPEFLLESWAVDKTVQNIGDSRKPIDANAISCSIEDLLTGQTIYLNGTDKNDGWSSVDLKGFDKSFLSLTISPTRTLQKSGHWAYTVEMNHFGNVQLTQTDGFHAGFSSIAEFFLSGSHKNKLFAKIEVLEPHDETTPKNDFGSHSNDYYMFNAFGTAIHKRPKTIKEYKLECSI